MIHAENHQTFLSYGELFSRSAGRCLKAERSIRTHISEAGGPYFSAMEQVADAQHQLANDLALHAEKGPDNLVCTRVQYILEETTPPEPESLEGALHYVTQINSQLMEMLLAQAEKVTLDTLRDKITIIAQEIASVNKRISMILLTAQDV